MKLTKTKLLRIIKEELSRLREVNPEAITALTGKSRAPKPDWADLGAEGPSKEDIIQAALLLNIDPDTSRNRMVLYNIGMLLKNKPDASPHEIVGAIRDAWEEEELVVGDEPLQEEK